MTRNAARLAVSAGLVLALAGCATTGPPGAPPPRSMPAARVALAPEYRLFYDALEDYGDWVLIEPYGFLFRPRVDFPSWRPYEEGFWAPTDNFGWVWISSEPFGWATYHYGNWFYDDYQGWVWRPGLDWGPAWVTWAMNDDYAAWSPLTATTRSLAGNTVPGGAFIYAPVSQLDATDLKMRIKREADLDPAAAVVKPVDNKVSRGGVLVNLGPALGRVERASGRPLSRVRVEDSLPEELRRDPSGGTPLIEETRRAAEEAARTARDLAERGAHAPSRLPIVRPLGGPEQLKPAPRIKPLPAKRDTTSRR